MESNDSADVGVREEHVTAPAPADVTLDEFCVRLSSSDRRVELLAAFHFVETRSGHFKDAESAYQSRFEAFVNKPV